MTPKQARFVSEYLVDGNGKQAAIRAGYSARTAESKASDLLKLVNVREAVAKKTQAQLARIDLTAERVKRRLADIAFADLRAFYDDAGNLKPLHALTTEQAAAIAQFEVIKKNAAAGDGVVDTVHKIRVADQLKALELLAKHFGLLVERVEHSGGIELSWGERE